jgi:processive 1,2-diacylglycerol beta-glucosyltransferase
MNMKRILIFYTSVGLGHKIIAQNIGWHLTQAGFEVKLADILEVQSGFLVDFGTWLHGLLNARLPFVWRFLYNSKAFSKLTLHWRVPLAAKNSARAAGMIAEFNPDLVITTQTTASAIVSYLKREGVYKNKFVIAFSDYHLHQYWLYGQADLYLANIAEQKSEMVRLGILPEKIIVAGITLQPRLQVDSNAVRAKLGLQPHEPVVLMASGSLGIGGVSPQGLLEFMNLLKAEKPDARVIIVCGKNEKMRAQLADFLKDTNALVFGYYSAENGNGLGMPELYSIADIFVTKPGGLSVAESLAWQLPLLITHWLPGGEDLNYSYLLGKKLIMPVNPAVKQLELAKIAGHELASHGFRNSLSSNASRSELTQENRLGQAIIQSVSQLLK